MDDNQTLSDRFERLRKWMAFREDKLKDIENEVLVFFASSNAEGIQKLMQKKQSIRTTNQKLSLFITRWEKHQTGLFSEEQ